MEMLKKILVWGFIAFLVFFVTFKPRAAIGVVTVLGNVAVEIFKGIDDFFRGTGRCLSTEKEASGRSCVTPGLS
jgi:hypothetical protein